MDLCNEKDIRALLGRHGFRFSKSMGQNFLIEGWVPRDIAEASGAGPDTGVLEIGPGIGPLTVQLAQRPLSWTAPSIPFWPRRWPPTPTPRWCRGTP